MICESLIMKNENDAQQILSEQKLETNSKNLWKTYLSISDQNIFLPLLHAEEDEGKTEDPTDTKKRKAREEGQIFFSSELPQALLILSVAGALWFMGGFLYENLTAYLGNITRNTGKIYVDEGNVGTILVDGAKIFMMLFSPFATLTLVVAILATAFQTKFFISFKLLKFDPKRILPSFKNLLEKTIFSRTQSVNAVKVLIKISVSVAITFFFFVIFFEDILSLFIGDLQSSFFESTKFVIFLLFLLGTFTLIIALPDWFVQRALYLRKLKMTPQEVKRETKELEGDPQIKQRQRERYRALLRREVEKGVKESDVVITNPTHFACALKYEIGGLEAPKLMAKGADHLAFRIRKLAKQYNVPIVENKPLARTLYEKVKVGNLIPKELYTVVAQILAKIDKFN